MTMLNIPDLRLYNGTAEWSALYVDGVLDRYGDSYLADERIREIIGVQIIDDDAWLLGGDGSGRNGNLLPAQTIRDIENYIEVRDANRRYAAELRDQAAKLLAEAELADGIRKEIR